MWRHKSINGVEKYSTELPECKGKIDVIYDGEQVKIKAVGYDKERMIHYEAIFKEGKKLDELDKITMYENGLIIERPEGHHKPIVYTCARDALKQLPYEIRKHFGLYYSINESLEGKL